MDGWMDGRTLSYPVTPNQLDIPQLIKPGEQYGDGAPLTRVATMRVESMFDILHKFGYDMARVMPSEASCATHLALVDSIK